MLLVLTLVDHWEVGLAGLMGAAIAAVGVAVRSGHLRRGVGRTYFNRAMPGYQRNAMFALIPGGLAFLLIAAAWGFAQARGVSDDPNAPADPVVSSLILVGMVLLGVFFWWMFRLPQWMKPDWVREYERAERAGEPVPDLRGQPMSPRAYALNWLGLFLLAGLWLALHLPIGPLLIGLGLGLTTLLANRPRRPT